LENKIENGAVSIVNWTGIMCVGSLVRDDDDTPLSSQEKKANEIMSERNSRPLV